MTHDQGRNDYILVVIRIWIRIHEFFWRNFIIALLATVKVPRRGFHNYTETRNVGCWLLSSHWTN